MGMWKGVLLGAGLFMACRPAAPGPEASSSPEQAPALPSEVDAPAPAAPPTGEGPRMPSPPPASQTDPNPRSRWLRASFYAGVSPEGLAVGDFNEDGAPDVAIHAGGRNLESDYAMRVGEFLLLLNDGTGRLAPAARPLSGRGFGGRIVAGDLDGDGHLDVLLGTHAGMQPLWGAGDGSLVARTTGPFTGGDISSLGLWSLGSGRPAIWAMGNWGGYGAGRPLAAFTLVRPEGPGQWSGLDLSWLATAVDGSRVPVPMLYITDDGYAPVVADFNEDGLPDVVTNRSKGWQWEANVLLSSGWGVVQPSGFLPREKDFLRVFAADFNRDGHLDVLGLTARSLEVYLGDGHGRFAGGGTWPLDVAAQDAAVLDFDADGNPDVVALHAGTAEISLLRGQGDGTLLPYGRLRVGRHPSAAVMADLDRDGTLELLVSEADDNTVSAYALPPGPLLAPQTPVTCPLKPRSGDSPLKVSAPSLASLQVGPVATSPLWVRSLQAVGDFDGDGHKDLALAQQGAVRLVLQPTEGTFITRDVPDTSRVLGVSAGDLDGDGRSDLAVTLAPEHWEYTWEGFLEAKVLWNDAEGLFRERTSYFGGRHDPLIADFNGDGRLDLAMTLTSGCPGPLIRQTNLGARTFREDWLTNYNYEGDDRCPDLGAPLAGDFNGDGTLDLLHTTLGININPTSREGTSLPGHGFESTFRFGRFSWAVDADGDGQMDVVIQNALTQTQLYRGDGHATLSAPFACPLPSSGQLFAYEDVNGDGLADVVGESPDGQGLWVGLGTGGGAWRTLHYALGGPVEWARGLDLLGDARPELVVLMRSGELRVLPTPGP